MSDTDDIAERPRDDKAVMLLGWGQALRALAAANARADAAEADRDRHHTTLTTLLDAADALLAQAETVSGECGEVVARLCRPLANAVAAATQQDTPT